MFIEILAFLFNFNSFKSFLRNLMQSTKCVPDESEKTRLVELVMKIDLNRNPNGKFKPKSLFAKLFAHVKYVLIS